MIQRRCTECEEFFEVKLTPEQLVRRDRAAELGGIAYVCDDCSGIQAPFDELVDDECWEWDGEDDDYVCHNCGDALPHQLVGTGAMCGTCEHYAEHPEELDGEGVYWLCPFCEEPTYNCDCKFAINGDVIDYDNADIPDMEDEIDRKAELMDAGRL